MKWQGIKINLTPKRKRKHFLINSIKTEEIKTYIFRLFPILKDVLNTDKNLETATAAIEIYQDYCHLE